MPDVVGCVELSPSKGYCTYTISDKEFIVDDNAKYEGQTWFDMRRKMILIPPKSWAEIKAFIIKICKNNKCEIKENDINERVDRIDRLINQ